jgi:plastocyanin
MNGRQRIPLPLLLLAAGGCASTSAEQAARPLSTGGQAATIEMSAFRFAPNVITLQAGLPLRITAVSKSRIPHNITILSLEGHLLKSVDVKAEQTVAFEVITPQAGRYVFFCDLLLHRWPLGMEGALVAKSPPSLALVRKDHEHAT